MDSCSPLPLSTSDTNLNFNSSEVEDIMDFRPSSFLTPFNGSTQQSPLRFLKDFHSYAALHKLDTDKRKIAAFSLYLRGLARTWIEQLSEETTSKWSALEEAFRARFITPNAENASDFYTEQQVWESISLAPSQNIEEFFSLLHEKGELLLKSDKDIMFQFVRGLPDTIAFFVRATQPRTSQEALTAARTAQAYSYGSSFPVPRPSVSLQASSSVLHDSSSKPPSSVAATQESPLQRQIDNLAAQVQKLSTHSSPVVCQLCNRRGHTAKSCRQVTSTSSSERMTCQLCNRLGHSAKFCRSQGSRPARLNDQGLGGEVQRRV